MLSETFRTIKILYFPRCFTTRRVCRVISWQRNRRHASSLDGVFFCVTREDITYEKLQNLIPSFVTQRHPAFFVKFTPCKERRLRSLTHLRLLKQWHIGIFVLSAASYLVMFLFSRDTKRNLPLVLKKQCGNTMRGIWTAELDSAARARCRIFLVGRKECHVYMENNENWSSLLHDVPLTVFLHFSQKCLKNYGCHDLLTHFRQFE